MHTQPVLLMQPTDGNALLHSAFYRFTPVEDPSALADAVRTLARLGGLSGSIVVASEGISGAVAGLPTALQAFEQALQQPYLLQARLRGIAFKHSACVHAPFARLKVSVKPEIVALGLPPASPDALRRVTAPPGAEAEASTATATLTATATDTDTAAEADADMLSPQAWHELLLRDDVLVLDNRNHFEFRLGHFRNAVDPQVHNFRDFVAYVERQAPAWRAAGRPVAMYCTGGIRCEKTAPWMRSLGLQVLQLEGGILNYLQQRPDAGRVWQGDCFVFDNRIALNSLLQETSTTAEEVFDAQHPDEAWRLQRARRLQQSSG